MIPGAPLDLGLVATPVERHVTGDGVALSVKRDDLTHPAYGGNKPRKLARILARATEKGATRIVTAGAIGSHHVLATAYFAGRAGMGVTGIMLPQPASFHALDNARAGIALGARLVAATSPAAALVRAAAELRAPGAFGIPIGGSTTLGAYAYVDAAFELAAQIRAGEASTPDDVVVTLGSGGTFAGIVAGLAAAGIRARVHGVVVSDPAAGAIALGYALLARTLALAKDDPRARDATANGARALVADAVTTTRYLGAGYGHATRAGDEASEIARGWGLAVDPTYTAKTLAAAIDLARAEPSRRVLYWHTLSSAPMAPFLKDAPSRDELPPELRALLT